MITSEALSKYKKKRGIHNKPDTVGNLKMERVNRLSIFTGFDMFIKRYIQVIVHIIFWILFVFFLSQVFDIRIRWRLEEGVKVDPAHPEVITFQFNIFKSLFIGLGFKLILFYVNIFYLLKRYSHHKKLLKYVIELTLLATFCFTIELVIKNAINSSIRNLNLQDVNDVITYFARINIVFYVLVLGFSFIYFFMNAWVKNERIKNHLHAEQLTAELSLLKSQIHPHFLFNTLNNLFGLAQENNNPDLASGIHTLSGMMRYVVYESNEKFVTLQKEILYIQDYLKIFELRKSEKDNVSIIFNIEGNVEDKKIAPMLLIPFVENACKHGLNFKRESFINIRLTIIKNTLIFSVINSNNVQSKDTLNNAGGLGLKNVHKRLELIYPHKHKLQIKSTLIAYYMKLILHL